MLTAIIEHRSFIKCELLELPRGHVMAQYWKHSPAKAKAKAAAKAAAPSKGKGKAHVKGNSTAVYMMRW
jgi:hypothetical protein